MSIQSNIKNNQSLKHSTLKLQIPQKNHFFVVFRYNPK